MDEERFYAIATEAVNGLERELRRSPAEERARWRALEIGCGSGRLMRPMSRQFAELHGVDVSAEAVNRARDYLRDLPNVRVARVDPDDFASIDAQSFDFIYGLDPSFAMLRQVRRLLKPGGYCWFRYEAQAPTRIDLLEFTQNEDFQVLALENVGGQGLWTSWRQQPRGWHSSVQGPAPGEMPVRIRKITNASSSEPVAPCRGRFATIAIYATNLPADAGLHHLRVTIGSSFGTVAYVGPADATGCRVIRADLPDLEATGLLPVQLYWNEEPISPPAVLRVIPPGPSVPRLVSLSKNVTAHALTLTAEEIRRPDEIEIYVGGRPVDALDYVCTDRKARRFEIAVEIPGGLAPGKHSLEMREGRRKFPPVQIEVVA